MRAVVIGVPVAAFAIVRPGPFLATVKSPEALVRIAALAVTLVLVSRLLRRFVASALLRAAIPSVLAVGVLAVVVLPYFRDETVVETLPTSAADLGVAGSAVPATPTSIPAATSTSRVTPEPATPRKLSSGILRGIDHEASGVAAVYRLGDGTAFVRLEDIDVENGPDYVLYIVPGSNRRTPGNGTSLGDLKGNQGTQNYAVPANVDLDAPHTVLIWCRAFAVPVANATQAAA